MKAEFRLTQKQIEGIIDDFHDSGFRVYGYGHFDLDYIGIIRLFDALINSKTRKERDASLKKLYKEYQL